MNPRKVFVAIAVSFVFLALQVIAQQQGDFGKPLPIDPNVTIGKLDNGITYYIRVNKKPEKRAELRLAVNAGSVLEDNDQRGLAHLCEHMAFNGTKNFQKQALVDYMESIGMRFGPEVNAYTSFDETVYMLTIPTDKDSIVKTAFQILEDWAHNVSYDSVEIDKERGVVIEEWRLGRGAEMRMADKQFPILLKGSKYADRLTIGKKEILESFPHPRLVQYYKDWYRPELMAVIAVGDFDKNEIERLIKEHFSSIPARKDERERTVFPVPDHTEPLFAIASDSEATMSRIGVYYLRDVEKEKTIGDYRKKLIESLYDRMLNRRFSELTLKPNPSFIWAYSGGGGIRSKDFHILQAAVTDNGVDQGLKAILVEAERVRRFGFTATELEREKQDALRSMEQAYNERDKTESRNFVNEYVSNFLSEEPIPGIENEYELYKQYLGGITLEEVNKRASELITEHNRVIMANCPIKQDVQIPTEASLRKVFDTVSSEDIKPYEDKTSNQPLVPNPPAPGTIVEEKKMKELSVTEWKLSNGVRVVLKPTDFKNDEILMTAFSPGGSSLVDDKDFIPATTASQIVAQGGVGTFDEVTLEKMLQGKIVSVYPFIGELEEGFNGSASPKDVETMLQLVYLYFTFPRSDTAAFLSYKDRMKGYLQNRSAKPETAFQDTVSTTLSQYHVRRLPWLESMLDKLDLQESFTVYRDRFKDASDFTFIIDGAFKLPGIKPLILTYLGGLPSINRNETWKDVGVYFPKGVINKTVKKGIEPKSAVQLVYTGPFEWTRENRHALETLTSVLRIKMREALREDKGGTYGVGVGATPTKYPRQEYRLAVGWGCAPERVEELIKVALDQIDSVKKFGVSDIYITKVKETQRREFEVNLKENRWWLSALQFKYDNHEDPNEILTHGKLIDMVSSEFVQKAAQKYIDDKNCVKVVLYPAATTKAAGK